MQTLEISWSISNWTENKHIFNIKASNTKYIKTSNFTIFPINIKDYLVIYVISYSFEEFKKIIVGELCE